MGHCDRLTSSFLAMRRPTKGTAAAVGLDRHMESVERGRSAPQTAMDELAAVERGIERIYRDGLEAFVRVVSAIIGDRDRAADVVHDGFARALHHAGAFRGDGPLEGWVWRVVVNEARRPRPAAPSPVPAPEHAPAPESSRDALWLRAVVASLPERQRLGLFLRYYADLDYESIAAAMEVAPGTVAATLNQAHANLRRKLEEANDGV
jgi:RNA polymerase sigma-70 factor, ECF subfamily